MLGEILEGIYIEGASTIDDSGGVSGWHQRVVLQYNSKII